VGARCNCAYIADEYGTRRWQGRDRARDRGGEQPGRPTPRAPVAARVRDASEHGVPHPALARPLL